MHKKISESGKNESCQKFVFIKKALYLLQEGKWKLIKSWASPCDPFFL
jgi:hypothetical protein